MNSSKENKSLVKKGEALGKGWTKVDELAFYTIVVCLVTFFLDWNNNKKESFRKKCGM